MNEQNYKEVSTIGRWGRMHGRYLKDNHPVRYTVLLLLSGKLNGYLAELDQQVKKQLELIVQQMAECEDVTEELKATDQIEWVRRINNIRNRAEEVIKTTLIYQEGAEKYSLGLTKFQELAKEAKAVYKIDKVALVNCEIFERYLESFHLA